MKWLAHLYDLRKNEKGICISAIIFCHQLKIDTNKQLPFLQDIEIDVMAIVNDTTGTLMSCAHKNRECRVGLIVGTGTNACYMEQLRNVPLMQPSDVPDDDALLHPDQVIVNTEWGAFGDNGCLDFVRTKWDNQIDHHSLNPGMY